MSQRKKNLGGERRATTKTKVHELLNVKFIHEVHYTTWLTNIVMVKKENDKWKNTQITLTLTKSP